MESMISLVVVSAIVRLQLFESIGEYGGHREVEDADDEEEPPRPSDNKEDMRDSDDETAPQIDYNSDDSYGF